MTNVGASFMQKLPRTVVCAAVVALGTSNAAFAVEGGSTAYLLGSRSFGAGFVPPPGVYISNDFLFQSGSVKNVSVGGKILADVDLSVVLEKPNITFVPATQVLGGRVGVNVQLPIASANMDIGAIVGGVFPVNLSDSEFNVGDPVITPMIGWDSGNFHYSLSANMYIPVGSYSDASVSAGPPVALDILSIGKNKFSIQPTASVTYLDPQNGLEFSSAVGLGFHAKNQSTDYQNGTELFYEGAIAQHLPNGFTLGVSGYAYQQIEADSGSGAASLAAAIGANKIQARVFGIGPEMTYATKIGDTGLNLKLKYVHEFGAKQRFESDVIWSNLTLVF